MLYTGFVRVTGYKSLLSTSDISYAVTALLECSAAAMDSSGSKENSSDDDDDSLSEEDREMVEAFNVAFDARNSNGGAASQAARAGGALATAECGDLSNLVNGGSMTGTTGLGAGSRLAMTLQRNIMAAARNLVDRDAITWLSHFRYEYLQCSSGGGGPSSRRVVTPDRSGSNNQRKAGNDGASSSSDSRVDGNRVDNEDYVSDDWVDDEEPASDGRDLVDDLVDDDQIRPSVRVRLGVVGYHRVDGEDLVLASP